MKKALIYWFGFLFFLLLATSCKSKVPKPIVIEKTKTVTVTETLRDTVLVTEKDSSYYKAYIECINNKPVLKNPNTIPGKNLKSPKVKLNGNQLNVSCEQEAQEMFFAWKEKFLSEITNEQIPIEVPAQFTDWQIVLMWCGRLFLLLFLIPIIYFIIKIIKR